MQPFCVCFLVLGLAGDEVFAGRKIGLAVCAGIRKALKARQWLFYTRKRAIGKGSCLTYR